MSRMETKLDGIHGPGIYGFFGNYRFLSNFWQVPCQYEGLMYPSSEAAYQAAKALDPDLRLRMSEMAPAESKAFGSKIKLREDWEQVKLQVMADCVMDKFTRNQRERHWLFDTLPDFPYLEETNYWNDKIWGVCKGEGRNHLGKILMAVRKKLYQREMEEIEAVHYIGG